METIVVINVLRSVCYLRPWMYVMVPINVLGFHDIQLNDAQPNDIHWPGRGKSHFYEIDTCGLGLKINMLRSKMKPLES